MSDSTRSTFEEGDTVILLMDYQHVATESREDGEIDEIEVESSGPRARYDIVSVDYERGFVYNLRLHGSSDEYDNIRVWGVAEEDIQKV